METALKSQPQPSAAESLQWNRMVHHGYVWHIRQGVPEHKLTALLTEPSREILKRPDNHSEVFKSSGFVAKHYFATNFADRAKCLWRGARARRALGWAVRLAELGIPTVRPIAIALRPRRPWESWLLSEYIEAARGINPYLESVGPAAPRRWIADKLADIMARLHNAGISYGDAHLANFLVTTGNEPRLILVDLDALRHRGSLSVHTAAGDLRRLLDYAPGSQREHLRFLASYARARTPRISSRQLLAQIGKWRRGPGPLSHAS